MGEKGFCNSLLVKMNTEMSPLFSQYQISREGLIQGVKTEGEGPTKKGHSRKRGALKRG